MNHFETLTAFTIHMFFFLLRFPWVELKFYFRHFIRVSFPHPSSYNVDYESPIFKMVKCKFYFTMFCYVHHQTTLQNWTRFRWSHHMPARCKYSFTIVDCVLLVSKRMKKKVKKFKFCLIRVQWYQNDPPV